VNGLEIVPGISLCGQYVSPHISPKSKDHINDDRGTHRQEGCIDKILPDAAGGDTHAIADSRTNAKGIPFNKAFEFVHTLI
jgi:hypothetical protein